jgi:hypothetical protein
MTDIPDTMPDQSALVYRYHEQLYRLALLVAGDADGAAALVERAYHELPAQSIDVEASLIRALLRPTRRRLVRRRRPVREEPPRHALDQERSEELLDVLEALPPAARLMVGLQYLRGMSSGEIAAMLGEVAGQRSPAETLARFRIAAAHALELVPADADDGALFDLDRSMDGLLADADLLALRRSTIEQPTLRGLRDALITLRDLLPRAIPALYAASPPPELTQRLLDCFEAAPASPQATRRFTRAHGGLVLGILALVLAITLLPSLLARRGQSVVAVPQTSAEIIDAAIHRFDHPLVQQGVLHEQYRVEIGNQPAFLIERWYEYADPHRLLTTVTSEANKGDPLMQISSDGRSLVQYRFGSDVRSPAQRSVDVHVSQTEAQKLLPLLRSEPAAGFFSRGAIDRIDMSPLYLAQARAANSTFLGQASLLGRSAYLLSYHSDQVPSAFGRRGPQEQAARVVLTIDAQTYALLDIAILADGATESTARHPIQALALDVSAHGPATGFTLPPTTEVVQQSDLQSARTPIINGTQNISLEDALRRAPNQLLVPQPLPDANMRGLALELNQGGASTADPNNDQVILLYEGEFQSILMMPSGLFADTQQTLGQEQTAGSFRYRLVRSQGDFGPTVIAEVYRPSAPDDAITLLLVDEYATRQERAATLQQLIASLTPITEQTLPVLRPNFDRLDTAGG